MFTRLGEAGVDAFTIMKIAGHSSVTVSQRYVHHLSEALERAFERSEAFNAGVRQEAATYPATVEFSETVEMPVSVS
jgi:hypothetical protein